MLTSRGHFSKKTSSSLGSMDCRTSFTMLSLRCLNLLQLGGSLLPFSISLPLIFSMLSIWLRVPSLMRGARVLVRFLSDFSSSMMKASVRWKATSLKEDRLSVNASASFLSFLFTLGG